MDTLTLKQSNYIIKLDPTRTSESLKDFTKKEASILIAKLVKAAKHTNKAQTHASNTSITKKTLGFNFEKLTEDLKIAKAHATKVGEANTEDGGTCNFDSPVLIIEKRIVFEKLEKSVEKAGLRVWKWFKNHYVITGFQWGQGNLHTRMAEAFHKKLEELGYTSSMYYQMD